MSNQNCSFDIRPTQSEDVEAIVRISRNVGVFSEVEVNTVGELLDDYFVQGAGASGYYFLSCFENRRLLGYSCHGPRALTDGTYDLYWIATDPAETGRGVGGSLLTRIRAEIEETGGRLIVAETSGKAIYADTRRFYEKHQFTLEAVIKDFYAPGDDINMYVARL